MSAIVCGSLQQEQPSKGEGGHHKQQSAVGLFPKEGRQASRVTGGVYPERTLPRGRGQRVSVLQWMNAWV